MDRMDFPASIEKRCDMMRKSFKEHALFLILSEDRFSVQWDQYEADPSIETTLEARLTYSEEQTHIARSEIAPRFQEFARAVENFAYETMSDSMKTLSKSIERDTGGRLRVVVLVECVANPDQAPAPAADPPPTTISTMVHTGPSMPEFVPKTPEDDNDFLRALGIAFDDQPSV